MIFVGLLLLIHVKNDAMQSNEIGVVYDLGSMCAST